MKQKIAIILSLVFILSSCVEDTIEIKEISEERPLSYEVKYVEDESYTTEEEVLTVGEDGVEEIVYAIEYKNDVEISKEKMSTKVIKEPTNKLIARKSLVKTSTTVSYRYYNSFEELEASIEDIKFANVLYGLKPKNNKFMIINMKYTGFPTHVKTNSQIINIPNKIYGTDIQNTIIVGYDTERVLDYYESLNEKKLYFDDEHGETTNVAVQYNLEQSYIEKTTSIPTGRDVNYITDSEDDNQRTLIFDIDYDQIIDNDSYLLIPSNAKAGEETKSPDKKIFLKDIIEYYEINE